MFSFFKPETVELVNFDGAILTFVSRRKRRQGRQNVRLLVAAISQTQTLDLAVQVQSARPVPGGTECSGPLALPSGPRQQGLSQYLHALTRAKVDRRRSQRHPTSFRVRSNQLSGFSGLAMDLSTSGLQLSVHQPLAPGTALDLELELDLPSFTDLPLRGQVRWCRNGRVGVELDGLSPQERRTLERYLAAKSA